MRQVFDTNAHGQAFSVLVHDLNIQRMAVLPHKTHDTTAGAARRCIAAAGRPAAAVSIIPLNSSQKQHLVISRNFLRTSDLQLWMILGMQTKAPTPPLEPVRLSPDCAYVVQLQSPQALTPSTLSGRVEHIASGNAHQFSSLEDLYAFMGQTLKPPRRRKGDRT